MGGGLSPQLLNREANSVGRHGSWWDVVLLIIKNIKNSVIVIVCLYSVKKWE